MKKRSHYYWRVTEKPYICLAKQTITFMKRILMTLCAAWTLTLLTAWAQPRLTVEEGTQSLGQIAWKLPVSVTYTVTNTGDAPLVLTHVEPDCSCTMANWTEHPIAPGDKGSVNVTFDAAALGHFQKAVAVYTNAEPHLLYLHFKGEVVREVKDYSGSYPYQIGEVRVDKNVLEFPDVQYGQTAALFIGLVNLSDHDYEPVLMHLPPYLQMEAEPAVLPKGEQGVIKLTLDSERLTDLGLTKTSIYLSRFDGDKIGEANELLVSAILLPGLSNLSEAEKTRPPRLTLSQSEVDLSAALEKRSKAHCDITVGNSGKSPLKISKLQVFHPAVGVSLKKSTLQPGETTKLRVSVTKKEIHRERYHLRLLMITNDPSQPKVEINIKGNT